MDTDDFSSRFSSDSERKRAREDEEHEESSTKKSRDDSAEGSPTSIQKQKEPAAMTKQEREQLAIQRRLQQHEEDKRKLAELQKQREQPASAAAKDGGRRRSPSPSPSPPRGGGSRRDRDRDRDRYNRDSPTRRRDYDERDGDSKRRGDRDYYSYDRGGRRDRSRSPTDRRYGREWSPRRDARSGRDYDKRGGREEDDYKRKESYSSQRRDFDGDDDFGRPRSSGKYGNTEDQYQKTKAQSASPPRSAIGTVLGRIMKKKKEEMTDRDWRTFKEQFKITATGGSIPNPIRNWEDSGLPDPVMDAVRKAEYSSPTPIQMQCIPLGLQNRDIIGIAETGSGKTAAFVLPMISYISKLPPLNHETQLEGPYALVMVPTHELAQQIEAETRKFATPMKQRVYSVLGGVPIEEQGFFLQQGCEILIATPGRLADCIDRRYLVLNQCNYIVLDEADKMIDKGFEAQLAAILEYMPSSNLKPEDDSVALEADRVYRQTIMFSATMPPILEKIAKLYMRRPALVKVGEVGKAATRIEQKIIIVKNENQKKAKLAELLRTSEPPIIVFGNTHKSCDVLAREIRGLGHSVSLLHGGKSQDQREQALDKFKRGDADVLVATNVACRGLDIKDVQHVINFELSKDVEDYVHRIGRTGRAGKEGKATSFVDLAADKDILWGLKEKLEASKCSVPRELIEAARAQGPPPTRRKEDVITSNFPQGLPAPTFYGGGGPSAY